MEVKVHCNIHIHFPPEPGQGETLSTIREIKDEVMNLNDKLAELTADDTELAADVNALVAIINDIPARIQAAVAGALANAGVTDDVTMAALNAVDSTVKNAIAAAQSVLPAPPPSEVDPSGQNTVDAGTGNDTILGGQSDGTTSVGGDGTSVDTAASSPTNPFPTDATAPSGDTSPTSPQVPPPSATSGGTSDGSSEPTA